MGIACLWVMLHHNYFDWPTFAYPLKRLGNFGNVGVDIFLLVSGIGLFYAWQKKPPLKTFYIRRIVRVLIPYLLIAVPFWIWRDLYLNQGSFILDVTQLSLPLKGVIKTWYIPAILVFYLCYPLVCKALETKQIFRISVNRHTMTVLLCAGIIFSCFLLRHFAQTFYKNCEIALTRSVVFVVGCDLGKTVYEKQPVRQEMVLGSLLTIVLYFILRQTASLPAIWLRFSYVPFAITLCICAAWVLMKLDGCTWLHRFLRFFGERSLEIYLSHVLLRDVFYHYFPTDLWDPWGILTYAVILLVSVGLSTLLHPVITAIYKKLTNG